MRTRVFYHVQGQCALLKGGLPRCPSTCIYIYASDYNSLVITLAQKYSWKSMKERIISASFHYSLLVAEAFITLAGIYISHKKYWTSFKFFPFPSEWKGWWYVGAIANNTNKLNRREVDGEVGSFPGCKFIASVADLLAESIRSSANNKIEKDMNISMNPFSFLNLAFCN